MGKNKKNILILFLFLFTLSLNFVAAQTKGFPIVKLFDKEYYKYEVKSKETVFSICKRFNVTEAELVSMNPFITNGLQVGQTLMIPIKAEKTEIKLEKQEIPVERKVENNIETKAVTRESKPKSTIYISADKPRVTILLPFEPTATPGLNERYIEFYEGFLLAVDSLKTLGLSFEVQAIESGTNTESIKNAILEGKLNETDYCVGGINAEQISLLSDWAKKNQKYLITPFSSHIPELKTNPYLFQTNTPHSYTYNRLSEFAVSRFGNNNIIFLNSTLNTSDICTVLLPQIKNRLRKANKTYTDVKYDDYLVSLTKALVDNRPNVIIPSPMPLSKINQFVTKLSAYAKSNPQKKIILMGYPEWQAMNKTYQKYLYELDTYIYSNFYANYQNQHVRDFQVMFKQNFGKELLNTYPKYSMIGYDVAAYFIPRMIIDKSEGVDTLLKLTPLQNEYRFGEKKASGGMYNKASYIIHYAPDNTVDVKIVY